MRDNARKLLAVLLTIIFICFFSGCSVIYKITAPDEYKNGYEIGDDYPEDTIPVYGEVIVYDFDPSEKDISLKAGSTDDMDDVVDFYMDYFDDNDIQLLTEKDRSSEYIAEGISGYYEFKLIVETPSGEWEERLYASSIDLKLKKVNIPNKDELKDYINQVEEDLAALDAFFETREMLEESEEEDPEFYSTEVSNVLINLDALIATVNERKVPIQDEFTEISQTELEILSLIYDIYLEYGQITEYMTDFMNAVDINTDSEAETAYAYFLNTSELFNNSAYTLEQTTAPSFMEDFNTNIIEVFYDMAATLDYLAYADSIGDNVRTDAGMYSLDMISREMDEISDKIDNDEESRNAKIDNDIAHMKDIRDGIIDWFDDVRKDIDNDAAEFTEIPEELILSNQETMIECNYLYPEIIIPANYRSLDYIAFVQLSTNKGNATAKVTIEIPGFTQKFEQKIDLSRAETELIIHPPLLLDAIENLNSSKEAQLLITVEDLGSGEIIIQDTKDITIYSRYDMQWADEEGTSYVENILAWVTPEAPEITKLLRAAADSASYLTGGQFDSIIGYQPFSDWYDYEITKVQTAAIMHALATEMNATYINESFSATDTSLQRVKTPAQVINTEGGLCCETAVTVASALQATGMHAVLILIPGHMQTAVETWYGSGEYYLIETTALSSAANENWDYVIGYYSPDDWAEYLDGDDYIAIDCELADQFGIKAID